MGILDRLLGRRRGPPRERSYDRYPQEEYPEEHDYEGPEETDAASLLVDHHLEFVPGRDHEKNVEGMEYVLEIENGTDYPMGNIRVEFPKRTRLLRFERPLSDQKMLDPGERMKVRVPAVPLYSGGKEDFEFEIIFFDFKYKVEERVVLKSEPIKIVVPKFARETIDEDRYRILSGELYRWSFETDIIEVPPKELYDSLKKRFTGIGFHEANEMVNEATFRGISQLAATDKKGRKWAVQIQVIGSGKESKLLLYTFGERPQYAYSLAVKGLLKLEEKNRIVASLVR